MKKPMTGSTNKYWGIPEKKKPAIYPKKMTKAEKEAWVMRRVLKSLKKKKEA
jgi:hypothetical protein